MRITGPNATALATAVPAARRTAAGGFAVAAEEAPRGSAPAASLRTVGGIDALVALQGLEDSTERRRRAAARGRVALDALDALKVGLLSGSLDPSALLRLRAATVDLTEASGDHNLDRVLAEIELRVEVEIAKLTPR
jgi:hypothetical protein